MWGHDTMCPDKAPIGTPTLSQDARGTVASRTDYPSWWRRTPYRHFGPTCDVATARSLIESPEAVARHAFWPFVRYDTRSRYFDYSNGKASFKSRSIQYPAHLDANLFAYYAEQLSALYEIRLRDRGLTDQVTAYRPLGRSNVDFAAEAFAWVRDHSPCDVYCFDVSKFFDNLDHELLKADWANLLGEERLPADHFAVFSAVTRYAYIQREQLPPELTVGDDQQKRYCTTAEFRRLRSTGKLRVERNPAGRGIPQGVQLCAVLSNLYMLTFDQRVAAEVERHGGFYRRYSDDILIALPAGDDTGFAAEAFLRGELVERRLPLNDDKTTCHRAAPGQGDGALVVTPSVVYLGLSYDGERILLRGATLARFHRRMTHAVQRARRLTAASGGQIQLPRGKLRKRFSHVGRRNFFSYVRPIEAVLQAYGFASSTAIRRQLRRSQARLERLLEEDG